MRGRTRRPAFSVAAIAVLMFASSSGLPSAHHITGISDVRVEVIPWGPTQAQAEAHQALLVAHPDVQRYLRGTRHRFLAFQMLEPVVDAGPLSPPTAYRAHIYDYTNDRTILVDGDLATPTPQGVRIDRSQPTPNWEEFQEALGILTRHDQEIASAIAGRHLAPYRPMPPLIEDPRSPGRTLSVGLRPLNDAYPHEIVGVNMTTETVTHFADGAPPTSLASEHICGPPSAGQGTASRGDLGQSVIRVTDGGTEIWRMVVIRPAASSGTVGSGIELRYLDYRGRRLLDRAHAPILNVEYAGGTCGPYRDWIWEEGMFDATGASAGAGFQRCSETPQAINDTGTDIGNFHGVGVRLEPEDGTLMLLSELEAGWYRYISEWRLRFDGTIQPRFRFSAVDSSCTCSLHTHHVYWRFDGGFAAATVDERDNASDWNAIPVETRRHRDDVRGRLWRIRDRDGGSLVLIPGPEDGVADEFGVGDVWVLRARPFEIDDGQGFTTDWEAARADIDRFVNNEGVEEEDLVVWYAAHVRHDASIDEDAHIVGPDLLPST